MVRLEAASYVKLTLGGSEYFHVVKTPQENNYFAAVSLEFLWLVQFVCVTSAVGVFTELEKNRKRLETYSQGKWS